MSVPQHNSQLDEYIENFFNDKSRVENNCTESCKKLTLGEKRSTLTSVEDSKFITIILSRAVQTLDGYAFNQNKTVATSKILIR